MLMIKNALADQLSKFRRKSYWKYFGLMTMTFYFTVYPLILSRIWPALLKTFSEKKLYILTVTFITVIFQTIYHLSMYFIYTSKIVFFQQFRISSEPWPWETDFIAWTQLFKKTIYNISLNALLYSPLMLYIDCELDFSIKMKMQSQANSLIYLLQFIFFLFVEEFFNYIIHFLEHQPAFYWIHKKHHEYTIPVSISFMYASPIEHIFSNSFSTAIGIKILTKFSSVHIFSVIIWLTFRIIESCDSHCGYNWPWMQSEILPFCSGEDYHYFHHRMNSGNYAGITHFMDTIFGTNAEFDQYCQKQKLQREKRF